MAGGTSEQYAAQRARGHAYLMGEKLSALDVYWAAMAALASPLPHEQCAMSDVMRDMYATTSTEIQAALDPELLTLRDRVYAEHMGLPIDL